MAEDVKTLLLQIDATTALLRSNLDKAEAAVGEFQRSTDRKLDQVDSRFAQLGKGIGSLRSVLLATTGAATGLLGALGIGAGVGAFVGLAKSGLDLASSLGEIAQQLGVTTEQLQVYRYAASQVGISQDEIDGGLAKLTKTLGQAQTGSATAAKVFDVLGVSLKNIDGSARTTGQVLPLIADALSTISDPAKRAAVEIELFGRAGQKLDTLLAGGSDAIDNLTRAAHDLGVVLSDEEIQNADRTADKLAELKQVLEARIAGAVAENAAAIYNFIDALVSLIGKLPEAIQAVRQYGLLFGEIQARFANKLTFGNVGSDLIGNIRNERNRLAAEARVEASEQKYAGALGRLGLPSGAQFNPRDPLGTRRAVSRPIGNIDLLNATGGGGRGGGGRPRSAAISELDKQIGDLRKSAIEATNALDKLEIDGPGDSVSKIGRLFGDKGRADFDAITQDIEAKRDGEQRLADFTRSLKEDAIQRRDDAIRQSANLYETLFRNGTSGLWREFKSLGISAVAEVLARLTAGESFNGALGSVFGPKSNGAGGVLSGLAGLFGGFREAGGPVSAGKAYVVGEKRAELFIPTTNGVVLPSVGRGRAAPTSVTVHVDPSPFFDVRVSQVAAPMAQQAVTGGAALAMRLSSKKARRRLV